MQEPNYRITDAQGNPIGDVGSDGNGGVVIEHASSGEQVVLDQNGISVSAVSTDSLSLTPAASTVSSFNGGQTRGIALLIASDPTNGPWIVTATPANDPGNNHGYTVDNVYWRDSSNDVVAAVTETENSGGGDAEIVAWGIGI